MSRLPALLIHNGAAVALCSLIAALVLVLPSSAFGAVSVTRAELKAGQLRVEGRGALPNATVTVASDSVASARSDGSGAFRVEASSFQSSTCRATVSRRRHLIRDRARGVRRQRSPARPDAYADADLDVHVRDRRRRPSQWERRHRTCRPR
jgi:hypothetical protein